MQENPTYPAMMIEVSMGWYVVECHDPDRAEMIFNLRRSQVDGDPRICDAGRLEWRPGMPWAPDSGLQWLHWASEVGLGAP